MLWKRCGKALAVFIFQNLRPVFGDDTADVDIKHLAAVKPDSAVVARRQARTIQFKCLDVLWVIHLSQGGAHASGFASGLVVTVFRLFITRTVEVRRGGLLLLRLLRVKRLTSNCTTNMRTSRVERMQAIGFAPEPGVPVPF